jgi:hypothetical protein
MLLLLKEPLLPPDLMRRIRCADANKKEVREGGSGRLSFRRLPDSRGGDWGVWGGGDEGLVGLWLLQTDKSIPWKPAARLL